MPTVPRRTTAKTAAKPAAKTATTETTDSGEKAPRESAKRRPTTDQKLRDSLVSLYGAIGGAISLYGMPLAMRTGDERVLSLGGQLATNAEQFADGWMGWADRNRKVKDALIKITEGGAAAELVMLHVGLVLPFLPGIPFLNSGNTPAPAPSPSGFTDMESFVPSMEPTVPVGPFTSDMPMTERGPVAQTADHPIIFPDSAPAPVHGATS